MQPLIRLIFILFGAMVVMTTRAESININEISADTSRVVDLDEVIVVAQPKESALLRKQPLGSSMFSGDDIQKLGIRDLRELSLHIPSFTMPDYGSRYTSSAYIRGIGSREGSSAIGMYVDGIPLVSKSMYNIHTYQLERVDMLRGAQGTLYGMNSEGGLMRLYTRNPMHHQGTDVNVSAGTYGYRNAEISHSYRFNTKFAASVAAFFNGQNGYFKNLTTQNRADRSNEAGGKLRASWKPSDALTLDYVADYQWVKQNGFPYGELNLDDYKISLPTSNYQGFYRRNLFNTGFSLQWQAPKVTLSSTTSFQYLRDAMHMDIDYTATDLMRMNQFQNQRAVTEEISLKGKSTKRWQWTSGVFASAMWHDVNAPIYFQQAMNDYLSQTIQDYAYNGMLNAMANRRMAELIAGGMEADAARQQALTETMASIAERGGCSIRMDMEGPITGEFSTPQQNLGIFHESNIRLTDQLTATVGLRYDLSYVGIDYATGAKAHIVESVLGVNVDARITDFIAHSEDNYFHQLLPKAALTYHLSNDRGNVYACFSKGYRAGGYNIQLFGDILQPELRAEAQSARADLTVTHDETDYEQIRDAISYKPETSWNYELGTHLNLLNRSLQLDASVFYMELHNQQVSQFANNYGYGRTIVNAAKSYSCGMELCLRGSLFDNRLSYNASYGYVHSVFKKFVDKIDGVSVSYKNNLVPYIPAHTLSARADYRLPISKSVLNALTFGVNMSALGKTYWDEGNTYGQNFYALLGAHVQAELAKDIAINLWARNLTNTHYCTFAFDSSASGTQRFFGQRGAPLQVGFDVSWHF